MRRLSGTPRRHRQIFDATSVLGRHAEPLASRAVAAGRRRSVGFHGLDHLNALATLACRSQFSRDRHDLSGSVQGNPRQRRCSLPDRLPVRGAESGPRPIGAAGGGLGLEQCERVSPVGRAPNYTSGLCYGRRLGRKTRTQESRSQTWRVCGRRSIAVPLWTEGVAGRDRESSRLVKMVLAREDGLTTG